MAALKSPSLIIVFKEAGASVIARGERGIVGLILKGDGENSYTVRSVTDIPDSETQENRQYIEDALLGYVNPPNRVEVYVSKKTDDGIIDIKTALKYFDTTKVNWIAAPTCLTDNVAPQIASWVSTQRAAGSMVKAVLPAQSVDQEGVVNWTSELIKGGTTYTPESTTPRIAGLLAGTPLTIAATYAPLNDYTDVVRLTQSEQDDAVGKGQLIAFWDGEKVKLNRAVTSFVTETEAKKESYKKIKLVEDMDLIREDLQKAIQDDYIGKYPNSYDYKCVLIAAINAYFTSLAMDTIIESGYCEIDIDRQRNYLVGLGKKVSVNGVDKAPEDLSDDEVKRANTGSHVFLKAHVTLLDVIEDIELEITV